MKDLNCVHCVSIDYDADEEPCRSCNSCINFVPDDNRKTEFYKGYKNLGYFNREE